MDERQILDRLKNLEDVVFGASKKKKIKKTKINTDVKIDLSLSIRAYAKKILSKLSGPKKFTLLLAYLTEGEVKKDISIEEIKKNWNKMKGKNMLGKYNAFYSGEAKNQGWVDSTKHGQYHLLKDWKEAA